MLVVESAGDNELQIGPRLPASSSPANGVTRSNWDASAANHEAAPEIVMSQHQPPGLSYTIKYESSFTESISFTEFIEGLRDTLANHPDREDIYDRHEDTNLSSSKKHPLLAKLRGDQQPSRLIEVKLQVTARQGMGGATSSSSTTLVIRDDNVDVMGFSNHNGDWFEVGNKRGKLPRRYNSKHLAGWVINKEETAKMLAEPSTALGKTFAEDAVRVLSCFPDVAAGGHKPRVALLGLMVMVCDSARLNPVHKAIADGWDTGARFPKQLIDTMGKYEWMSRGLYQWSRRNYAEPHPTSSQLQDVCLVLNGPPEVVYTIGNVPEVVYNDIGDEVSFISFMIDLRRNLSDHPEREDILNKHPDRNLSSTQEHPLLPRHRAPYPKRWIHVKLQMVEEGDGTTTRTTTLLMRDDNSYVHGFINQQGVVYGLVDDNPKSAMELPNPYMNRDVKEVKWSVQYETMLKAASNDDLMKKLAGACLGREFAREAVRKLSRYDPSSYVVAGYDYTCRLALAGLIFMVCESARMNPLHNAFARGWTTGTGFTKELMILYVWEYGDKSRKLLNWRDQRYVESRSLPHPIEELQDVYLVLNPPPRPSSSTSTRRTPRRGGGGGGNGDSPPPPGAGPGGGADNNDSPPSPGTGDGKPPPDEGGGGNNDSLPPPGAGDGKPPPGVVDGDKTPPSSTSTPRPPTSSSSTTTSREAAADGVANTSGGSGNTAGSSSTSASASQTAGRNAGADTGSALQPVDEGHSSSLSRGNSGSQSEDDAYDDDAAQGHGRPLVELLAIHADLRVLGTKIIVYDWIRGQIIYTKEEEQRKHIKEQKEQGEQAMDELVLTGPYTCISAYGCFAIHIDIPDDDGAAGSSEGGDAAGGLIEWEWDCYDPKYGEEVDGPPVTHPIASSGPGRNVEVTYAVMSNAMEATVQVMFFGLEDGHGPASDVVVRGEVTARIQDFQVGSVLFRRTQWAGHCFSHTDGSCFRLELARNVLAVPCGSKLHIRVKLATKFSNTEADGKDFDVPLDFDNGTLARHHEVDGTKIVEVKISWYPKTEMATAHGPEQLSEVVDEEEKFVSALGPSHPAEAEAASATAAVSEREEQCHKAKEYLDVGAAVTVFSFTVLLGSVFLPEEAKHPGNVRLTVSLLLSFATFLSGKALVLLSLNMMGRQVLVSGGHRVAAKCLVAACAVLSVLTLLSLLYLGLSVVTATMLSAAGAHWFLRRMKGGGGEAAVYDEEDKGKEELDAASKITCGITNSAFGGLVGALFSESMISPVAAYSLEGAAHAAIFFTFTTAILGVFVMTVSKVTNRRRRRRRLLATAMRLANALLLCSVACAQFATAFVLWRHRVFAVFAPFVFPAALFFLLWHCAVRYDDGDGDLEAWMKEMEDFTSKATVATLGGFMIILGVVLGEEDHDKWGSTGVLMVVLTCAFVSCFGYMVLKIPQPSPVKVSGLDNPK